MPRGVRAITMLIAEMADRYCADRRYPLMAGYLFLRVINPAVVSPSSCGLIPADLSLTAAARQNLVVLSKVLQHLSNGTHYTQYPKLDSWISNSQPNMEQFLDRAIYDEVDPDRAFADELLAEARDVDPESVDNQILSDLHIILTDQYQALVAVRSRLEKSSNDVLVALYDELFAAMNQVRPPERVSPRGQPQDSDYGLDDLDFKPPTPRGHVRGKKSVDLTARSRGVDPLSASSPSLGHMKDKVLKFIGSKGSNASAKSTGLKDSVISRLDTEDLSLSSNIAVFLVLRGMLNKSTGVNANRTDLAERCFCVSEAVGWIEEQLSLSHRGNALVMLRMMEEKFLILPQAGSSARKIQDDDSFYVVDDARFRIWDGFVGANAGPEQDSLSIEVRDAVAKALQHPLTSRSPSSDTIVDVGALEQLVQLMQLYLRGYGSVVFIQLAQEWLVLYGEISHEQTMDLFSGLFKARLIAGAVPGLKEPRDDVLLLLNCISAAFVNQRARHAKLWDRVSVVDLLVGEVTGLEDDSSRSEFGLRTPGESGSTTQYCKTSDFHGAVQNYAGKGKHQAAQYWLDLWNRLEEGDYIRRKHVVRIDVVKQKWSEPFWWFVTSAGCEFLLEQQSHIPLCFVFGNGNGASLERVSVSTPAAAPSPSKGFFGLRKTPSTRHLEHETSSGSLNMSLDDDVKKSPRTKLMNFSKKQAPALRNTSEVRRTSKSTDAKQRSGDFKEVWSHGSGSATPQSGDESNGPPPAEFQRSDSAPSNLSRLKTSPRSLSSVWKNSAADNVPKSPSSQRKVEKQRTWSDDSQKMASIVARNAKKEENSNK